MKEREKERERETERERQTGRQTETETERGRGGKEFGELYDLRKRIIFSLIPKVQSGFDIYVSSSKTSQQLKQEMSCSG